MKEVIKELKTPIEHIPTEENYGLEYLAVFKEPGLYKLTCGWHQEMLFSVDGAVDMIKHLAERLDEFNGQTLSKESVAVALDFLTNNHAIRYYKANGKLPTIRTLGKVAQAVENGITLDEDVLNDYTECPAY